MDSAVFLQIKVMIACLTIIIKPIIYGQKMNNDPLKPLLWAIVITAIISTMDWNSYLFKSNL